MQTGCQPAACFVLNTFACAIKFSHMSLRQLSFWGSGNGLPLKKVLIIILFVFSQSTAIAQQGGASPQDAARLDKIWKTFLDGISRHDTALLNSISLPSLCCPPCAATGDTTVYFPSSHMFTQAFKWPGTPFWNAITGKYWINTIVTATRSQNVVSTQKHFLIYELSFVTTPSTSTREGVSHLFQFIDLGGTLKFYGLAIVP